jgi:hypothetical protein
MVTELMENPIDIDYKKTVKQKYMEIVKRVDAKID